MNLKEQLKKLLLDMRAIAAKAEEEAREFTAEERQQLVNMAEDAAGLKKQIKEAEGDAKLRQTILDLGAGIDLNPDPGKGQDQPGVRPGKGLTIGDRFVNSPEWQKWWGTVAPTGKLPDGARGLISPAVEFKGLADLRRKEVVTGLSNVSAGPFIIPDITGIYEPIGRFPLTVLDLINRRTTTSDSVYFVRQTRQVTQAVPVAEANVTDYTGATGEESGEKPEATVRFEPAVVPVEAIAVWIPATKRALSDAAQLRGILDNELRDDLYEELENQILNGNGVTPNFTGILNTAGVLVQVFTTDILTTTRQAITTLYVSGRSRPTGWLFHPTDWETIDLLQDNNGQYYWGGPRAQGPLTLWGVPVALSVQQPQGTALLGDWRKAVLWDREMATIQVSDSHADFFIRNMVAILAELRAAFGLIRPSGFVEVTLEEGS